MTKADLKKFVKEAQQHIDQIAEGRDQLVALLEKYETIRQNADNALDSFDYAMATLSRLI